MRLSKAGYGTPSEILNWDTLDVMLALEYEKFLIDYEQEYLFINKPETK